MVHERPMYSGDTQCAVNGMEVPRCESCRIVPVHHLLKREESALIKRWCTVVTYFTVVAVLVDEIFVVAFGSHPGVADMVEYAAVRSRFCRIGTAVPKVSLHIVLEYVIPSEGEEY